MHASTTTQAFCNCDKKYFCETLSLSVTEMVRKVDYTAPILFLTDTFVVHIHSGKS